MGYLPRVYNAVWSGVRESVGRQSDLIVGGSMDVSPITHCRPTLSLYLTGRVYSL